MDDRPTTRPAPPGPSASGGLGLRVLGVSEATRAISATVRADERLRDLWVEGEVGRVTISSAGHAYFALRDEHAQLPCVWFRDDRLRSAFQPQTGLRVVAHGRVDFYEPQGALQLYVDALQPSGQGDLAVRFEQLKARLAAEGLFAAERKRPLPVRPPVIAVVTSPTGVVWLDICNVLRRRWPLASVLLVACQVQGESAPASIVAAFRRLERHLAELAASGRPEAVPGVTILARGGGSLEDLWSFNDERVVRAIVGHPLPVVCGVGHEIDVTLADFAADVRAPTPSAAAEIVVPDRREFAASLARGAERMHGAAERIVGTAGRQVTGERRALERLHPAAALSQARERVGGLLDRATAAVSRRTLDARAHEDRLTARLRPLVPGRLGLLRATLGTSAAALAVLGPQATLERGYAIVRRTEDGAIVRAPAEAPPATALGVRVARGEFPAVAADRPPG